MTTEEHAPLLFFLYDHFMLSLIGDLTKTIASQQENNLRHSGGKILLLYRKQLLFSLWLQLTVVFFH